MAVRYGQAIQLSHGGTGELCGVRLLRGDTDVTGELYELGLDTSMPDPYLEGRCATRLRLCCVCATILW